MVSAMRGYHAGLRSLQDGFGWSSGPDMDQATWSVARAWQEDKSNTTMPGFRAPALPVYSPPAWAVAVWHSSGQARINKVSGSDCDPRTGKAVGQRQKEATSASPRRRPESGMHMVLALRAESEQGTYDVRLESCDAAVRFR